MVTYLNRFGVQGYFVNIPSKFISKDGKTMWLCYSANWANNVPSKRKKTVLRSNPPGTKYALCLQEIKLDAK